MTKITFFYFFILTFYIKIRNFALAFSSDSPPIHLPINSHHIRELQKGQIEVQELEA